MDSIDGGEGTDTLSVVDTAAFAGFAGATIKGIETLSISSGAIGAIRAKAGTTTSGVTPVSTLVLNGTYAEGDTIKVTVGGQEVIATVGAVSASAYSGRAEAAAAIIDAINGKLGDAVTVGSVVHDSGTGTTASTYIETAFTITGLNGASLPSISVAKGTVAADSAKVSFASATASQGADVAAKTVRDGVQATATTAVKQQTLITIGENGTSASTNGVIKLVVDGSEYTRTATGATAAIIASDVAALINSVLGADAATSSGAVVTVTAATAGVAIPALNLSFSGYTTATGQPTDAHNYSIANVAANAVETAAAAIAAPTGVTSFTAAAAGVANVSAATTSVIDVTGTAVRSSGGSDVTVTASNSVHVSGAKGAVTIKTGTTSTTMVGAVAADTATGTAGDGKGVYVTGGTNVTITGTSRTTDVKVGTAPFAIDSVNTTGGLPKVNGSASLDPTGDVSITRVTTTTSTVDGTVSAAFSGSTAKVYMNGGSTATVRGAGATDIVDVNTLALLNASGVSTIGTSKLATVNLSGLSGTANITSDAISTVSVTNSRSAVTVNVLNSGETGANSGPINYVLSNVGSSDATRVTLVDNTTGAVNISSGAASTYTGSRNTGSESFVTISSTKATAINLTNSLAVNLGDVQASAAKVATVNGGSATGAVSLTIGTAGSTPEQGLSVTTGSGNDTVTVKTGANLGVNTTSAAVTTVNLGEGNDALLNGSTTSAVATVTGAAFNGGAGVDTVAASLVNAGNAAQFVNFEVLGLDRATGTTTDANLLSGVTGLALLRNASLDQNSDLVAGTVTYTNVKASQGLTVTGSAAVLSAGVTALSFEAAVATGTADSYTVGFAGVGTTSATAVKTPVQAGIISLDGIETVNVVSGSAAGFTANAINLNNASATKLVLSGTQDLDVDFGATDGNDGGSTNYFGTAGTSADTNGVALIDGSGMSGKLLIDTTDVGVAYAGLTVKGGSGNDTITLAQAAVVGAGAGDDTITVSSAGAIVSGGAGKDTFDVTAAVYGNASVVTNVTDLAAGDVIKGLAAGAANALLGTKADVSTATSLADALELANGTAGTSTSKTFWFQYGGNTYILEDALDAANANASGTFGAEDTVVKIDGLMDLSNSVWASSGLLTIV